MNQRPPPDDAWFQHHAPRLSHGAWLLTGHAWEAEDLVQETFVQALLHWDRFEGRSQESTWLYAIMLRCHRRRMRSVARAAKRLRRWWEETGSQQKSVDPAEQVAQKHWAEGIWGKVSSLSTEHQQALVLRFGEGMSYEEMAEIMGIPVGTARTRVHYGLEKLRGFIKQGSKLSFEPSTSS